MVLEERVEVVARVQGCSKATRARLYAAHLRVDRCAGALGATYVGAVREDELTHERVFLFRAFRNRRHAPDVRTHNTAMAP